MSSKYSPEAFAKIVDKPASAITSSVTLSEDSTWVNALSSFVIKLPVSLSLLAVYEGAQPPKGNTDSTVSSVINYFIGLLELGSDQLVF